MILLCIVSYKHNEICPFSSDKAHFCVCVICLSVYYLSVCLKVGTYKCCTCFAGVCEYMCKGQRTALDIAAQEPFTFYWDKFSMTCSSPSWPGWLDSLPPQESTSLHFFSFGITRMCCHTQIYFMWILGIIQIFWLSCLSAPNILKLFQKCLA